MKKVDDHERWSPRGPGDEVLFAQGGRLIAVRVVQLGEKRGPSEQARALYETLDAPT